MDQLAVIDYIIIGVYMAGVLFIGSYFGKYVQTSGDLFLAGRSLPFWAIGMSIVVSDIGALDMIGGAGGAYDRGIAQANFDWLGSVPALLLAAFIFVPYYWRRVSTRCRNSLDAATTLPPVGCWHRFCCCSCC